MRYRIVFHSCSPRCYEMKLSRGKKRKLQNTHAVAYFSSQADSRFYGLGDNLVSAVTINLRSMGNLLYVEAKEVARQEQRRSFALHPNKYF